jgi:hypothetical protein
MERTFVSRAGTPDFNGGTLSAPVTVDFTSGWDQWPDSAVIGTPGHFFACWRDGAGWVEQLRVVPGGFECLFSSDDGATWAHSPIVVTCGGASFMAEESGGTLRETMSFNSAGSTLRSWAAGAQVGLLQVDATGVLARHTGAGDLLRVAQVSATTTVARPAGLAAGDAGTMVFDTTLGKPIWWNGTVWKDATGTTV